MDYLSAFVILNSALCFLLSVIIAAGAYRDRTRLWRKPPRLKQPEPVVINMAEQDKESVEAAVYWSGQNVVEGMKAVMEIANPPAPTPTVDNLGLDPNLIPKSIRDQFTKPEQYVSDALGNPFINYAPEDFQDWTDREYPITDNSRVGTLSPGEKIPGIGTDIGMLEGPEDEVNLAGEDF